MVKEAPVEAVRAQQLRVTLNGEKVLVLVGEENAEGIAPLYDAGDRSRRIPIGTIRKNPLSKITGWSDPKPI